MAGQKKEIFSGLKSLLTSNNVTYYDLIGIGTAVVGFSWFSRIEQKSANAEKTIRRLKWELSEITEQLDFFDEIDGPDGLMQHSIWFHYLDENERIRKELKDYEYWNNLTPVRKLLTWPPGPLLCRD